VTTSDEGTPDAGPGGPEQIDPGDDPVRQNSVTWLLNDLKSVDSDEDLFGAGLAAVEPDEPVEPAEAEIARAVNSVELPDDVLTMAKLVPPAPRHLRASSPKPRHLASAGKKREANAVQKEPGATATDGEEWTRPDAPISVATQKARSFWRRPRNSWGLRVGVAAVFFLVCAGLASLSWQAINDHTVAGRGQILSQSLPTTTSIANVTPSTVQRVRTVHRHHKPPAKRARPPAHHKVRHVVPKGPAAKPPTKPPTKTPTHKPVTKHKKKPPPVTNNGSLLTAAVAQTAFNSTWPAFATGADAGSASALTFVATPSAIKLALAGHDCACAWWPASTHNVRMTSPEELAYPLSFAAEIDDTAGSDPRVIVAILQQQSASAPWMVSWVVTYRGTSPVLPATSSFDATRPVIAAGTLTTPITELASLFEAVRSTGYPPPTNFWTSFLSRSGEPANTAGQLIADHATSVELQRTDVVSYSASRFSPVFASASGYFACGEIDSVTTERPAKGSYLVQPSDHSAYGPTLTPGVYLSVTSTGSSDFCIDVSLAGSVAPAGLTGGVYSTTGVAAGANQP
jgi:hypothetical protein